MADDDWRYEGLRREIGRVDGRVERLERRLDEKDRKSWERSLFWFQAVVWTFVVISITALVVLAITHNLHKH
jgi:hypothetical protein